MELKHPELAEMRCGFSLPQVGLTANDNAPQWGQESAKLSAGHGEL
jgi:hypothetical protein